jgi:transposase InsO family protein
LGSEFIAELTQEFLKLANVKTSFTTAWRPQANGACERMNRAIIELLKAVLEKNLDRWDEFLPFVVNQYNSTVHSSTGFSPYQLMFGRYPNLALRVPLSPC